MPPLKCSRRAIPDYLDFDTAIAELEAGLPSGPDAGFLGSRVRPEDARLVLLPVPWEATTSYGGGTRLGPQAIIRASHQLDLEDPAFASPYRAGIAFLPESERIQALNLSAKQAARRAIEALEQGLILEEALQAVNHASTEVNRIVQESAEAALRRNQLVGLVGGDHSSPLGLIRALAQRHPEGFGILHIDAHHDLRRAYEGFEHSHASIFYNVMREIPQVRTLVQVGIRDYARGEKDYLASLGERAHCFYDAENWDRQLRGEPFGNIVDEIMALLPQRVYISFDIDGLEPSNCPSTGTPVPGGLSYQQANFLLERLACAGCDIIGFDLCEVAPAPGGDEWDANVGARMLYKLCGCLLHSNRPT